jgi:hypothetical protein
MRLLKRSRNRKGSSSGASGTSCALLNDAFSPWHCAVVAITKAEFNYVTALICALLFGPPPSVLGHHHQCWVTIITTS